jgi:hypothetical protein
VAVHVAGQGDQVDLDPREETKGHRGQLGQEIEVRVAEMENAVAIKGRRKVGKRQ